AHQGGEHFRNDPGMLRGEVPVLVDVLFQVVETPVAETAGPGLALAQLGRIRLIPPISGLATRAVADKFPVPPAHPHRSLSLAAGPVKVVMLRLALAPQELGEIGDPVGTLRRHDSGDLAGSGKKI